MRRPEKITEITIAFAPTLMVGQVLEIMGAPRIIVGIAHTGDRYGTTSRLRVVEPNWRWRLTYHSRKILRRAWLFITRPVRWLLRRPGG